MADSQAAAPVEGPPYPVPIAVLGGVPVPSVDDPISAVFLALFLCLAAVHMTIYQLNRRKSHLFVFSGLLFALSMARSSAMVMRIVWAANPTNVRIALAANILSQAGVVILFIANLFFAQRMVRAYLPPVGWHAATRWTLRGLVSSVIACLVMVIVTVIHSSYTTDRDGLDKDRKVQLVAGTFFVVLAFLPIPVKTTTSTVGRPEKFGTGRLRTKVRLLLFTSFLLTLGAAFRVATMYAARPANNPAWYHSRACYYCFNFVIEVIVSGLYAAVRFDRRFHVPNGSKGPGDYSRKAGDATATGHVNTEEEVFGAGSEGDEASDEAQKDKQEKEEV
ncbi:uncharacterized protein B0I36DRAFT_253050 [Microdochium trichocladiopsis]|uniref:Family c-likeg-protein-coupled receptor protein n=1 Tax=Microdochium trichocladiopsis TaxID=1682393 RepID=A0A9P8XVA2_9PEZI|nr:uncharacterized protein B0I36DRAFT_253050 [Microdochium trichocladiopsis]KAH7018535.1 hypothetical protein B0I36DRAFT_253050 [Microdochium trichocladiopsis]